MLEKMENYKALQAQWINLMMIKMEKENFVFIKKRHANMPMVGCDNCDNWYHLVGLKLKDFPKVKKWYCKLCKSSKK